MAIYEKPTKTLMLEFVKEVLKPGQTFEKQQAVQWFKQHYPNIRPTTVQMHVDGMAINSRVRKHHPSIRPGSGHDLFLRLDQVNFASLIRQMTDNQFIATNPKAVRRKTPSRTR